MVKKKEGKLLYRDTYKYQSSYICITITIKIWFVRKSINSTLHLFVYKELQYRMKLSYLDWLVYEILSTLSPYRRLKPFVAHLSLIRFQLNGSKWKLYLWSKMYHTSILQQNLNEAIHQFIQAFWNYWWTSISLDC